LQFVDLILIGGTNAINVVMDSLFGIIMTQNKDMKSGHTDQN